MGTCFSALSAIDQLRTLPREYLPVSALVDFILLFGADKPAVRIQLIKPTGAMPLLSWCRDANLDLAIDEEYFTCISVERGAARRILQLDRSAGAHEIELGLALGYPACCCQRVAAIGEAAIDRYAREVERWSFTGPYHRINPSGYRQGLALVSHLPCAVDCQPSLAIANRAHQFIINHAFEPVLSFLAKSKLVVDK